MSGGDLFSQQRANRRRSALLIAGFVLFFAWLGFGGDLALWLMTRDAATGGYRHGVPLIGVIAVSIAAAIALHAWRHGARRVLNATGAWELLEPGTPEQQRLDNVVEEMSIASGLPKPRVWIVPDRDPNAFATGRDPTDAHVAVTEGLLMLLNRDELQGVVAHELAHIRNFDVRLMTLLAAMVGAIALMSDTMGRFLRVRGGRSRGGRGKGGGGLALLVLAVWLLSMLLAPLISRLLAMAVSRKREYLADATAAQFTRNPGALAAALEKLDGAGEATRAMARGAAHLCIVDPSERRLSDHEGPIGAVFASHPPLRLRVTRLRGMAYQFEQQGSASP